MWTAKLKLFHEDCVMMPKCIKYKVKAYNYAIGAYKKDNKFYYTHLHILSGDERAKNALIMDLKHDKRVKRLKKVGKDIIVVQEELGAIGEFHNIFYMREFFQVKPNILDPSDGYEHWEIASWESEVLAEFIKRAKRHCKVELEFIKRTKREDIFMPKLMPELTERQKTAFYFAIRYGYYSIPRKIHLEGLANKMGVSRQAFEKHLHKAEIKLLSCFVE